MIRTTARRVRSPTMARQRELADELARRAPSLLSSVGIEPRRLHLVTTHGGQAWRIVVAFDDADQPKDIIEALLWRREEVRRA